jgi:hypothetical protein
LVIAAFSVILAALLMYVHNLNNDVVTLKQQVIKLETQVSPMWAKVQAVISADLHHPDQRYHEMDGLLEKLEALTITVGERERLEVLLIERSQDMHPDISQEQRENAGLMIQVMKKVLKEAVLTKTEGFEFKNVEKVGEASNDQKA